MIQMWESDVHNVLKGREVQNMEQQTRGYYSLRPLHFWNGSYQLTGTVIFLPKRLL
jgi:hypothetical protein